MNSLVSTTAAGDAVTTSSAIAEGVGMSHKSVIQLIRKRLGDLEEFGRVAFEMRPFHTAGGEQQQEVACLNERQSTLLMAFMRNSAIVVEFKKRLVRAFFELATNRLPQSAVLSRLELLQVALASEQERLRLASEVEALEWQREIDRHKVAFAESVQARAGDMDVRKAAQLLSNSYGVVIGQKRLFAYLRDIGWLDNRSGVYQRAINQGVLSQRFKTRPHPRTGETIHYTQVLITSKGLARLHERLSRKQEGAA